VKLAAIALDYDGTITNGDRVDESVRNAIAALRSGGIFVFLVTGRILTELARVAGDLHFVDAVVAENGAVVHFPGSGHTKALAPSIPRAFVNELGRRSIPFVAGQCLVDANADDGPRLLDVTRTLELPLEQLFNRSRVMVLPQGASKATGLHAALEMLRLSARNTLAIGDAENDHELLRIAEIGVAVSWGSAALRAVADLVVSGAGPGSVASFLRTLAVSRTMPLPSRARRRLQLGFTEDGHEFSLAVRGRNVLVAGDAKSGKSWVAGLLCEQLILHGYSVCVLDPEGDYRSMEALPGVEHTTSVALQGYLKRGDFSRWIRDVFGDHALASELRAHEDRYRRGDDLDIAPELVAAIRSRYDLTENGSDQSLTAAATSRPAA
jgi:hydroxymethylpyrimidine pyrophosphatase-like HAD family hydrolase